MGEGREGSLSLWATLCATLIIVFMVHSYSDDVEFWVLITIMLR